MLTGQIINGLVIGSMYALVAIGFTLIIGVLDKLNFAHPEVFMIGSFAAVAVVAGGASVWWALPVAFVVGGLLGLLTEFVCFRKFQSEDARITAALSSVALGLVIVDLTHKFYGTEPISVRLTGEFFHNSVQLSGIRLGYIQFVILAITFSLMLALHLYINRTGMGRQIRAVAESPVNAGLLGVNVKLVTKTVFFISSALAAVAGLLLTLRTGVANADIGLMFGLKAIAIMAIGGMGDLRGAVLAGLLIGVLEALSFEYGLGRLGEMTVWLTMIIVLLFRPNGLFGGSLHSHEARA